MQEIKEYIFSLMIVSVCCGMVSMLMPDNSRINKYVQFILSLVVTTILLNPIGSLIGIIPELIDTEALLSYDEEDIEVSLYADLIIKKTEENIAREVSDMVEARFRVKPVSVTVECTQEGNGDVRVKNIYIIFNRNNRYLYSDTEKYISDMFNGECGVICRYEDDQS